MDEEIYFAGDFAFGFACGGGKRCLYHIVCKLCCQSANAAGDVPHAHLKSFARIQRSNGNQVAGLFALAGFADCRLNRIFWTAHRGGG